MKPKTTNHDAVKKSHADRRIAGRCAELATRAEQHTDGRGNGIHPTAIAQLKFMRDDASTTVCDVYEPG